MLDHVKGYHILLILLSGYGIGILERFPKLKFILLIPILLFSIISYESLFILLRSPITDIDESLIIILSYLILIFPVGSFISCICKSISKNDDFSKGGLTDAGKWIGRLERTICLTLILVNKIELISWIIGMKGIMRFGEIRSTEGNTRKEVEYIIIGTFLSIGLTLIIGLFLKNLKIEF